VERASACDAPRIPRPLEKSDGKTYDIVVKDSARRVSSDVAAAGSVGDIEAMIDMVGESASV